MDGNEREGRLARRSPFGRPVTWMVFFVLVLVAGAVGCSGGDVDGQANPERATTSPADPSMPSAALLAWFSGFCRAEALPEGASSPPAASTPTSLEPDPAAVIAQTRDYLRQVAEYYEARTTSTTALGPVPIEGGAEIAQYYVDSLQSHADDVDALADSVAGIDPADPDALDRLTRALTDRLELGFQLSGALALPTRQSRPLDVAYKTAEDCRSA